MFKYFDTSCILGLPESSDDKQISKANKEYLREGIKRKPGPKCMQNNPKPLFKRIAKGQPDIIILTDSNSSDKLDDVESKSKTRKRQKSSDGSPTPNRKKFKRSDSELLTIKEELLLKTEPEMDADLLAEFQNADTLSNHSDNHNGDAELGPTSFSGLFKRTSPCFSSAFGVLAPSVAETSSSSNPSTISSDFTNSETSRKNKQKRAMEFFRMINPFKCMSLGCMFSTARLAEMKNHVTKHRNSEGSLKCAYCLVNTRNFDDLVHHLKETHKNDIFQCAFCFHLAEKSQNMAEHYKKNHPGTVYARDNLVKLELF